MTRCACRHLQTEAWREPLCQEWARHPPPDQWPPFPHPTCRRPRGCCGRGAVAWLRCKVRYMGWFLLTFWEEFEWAFWCFFRDTFWYGWWRVRCRWHIQTCQHAFLFSENLGWFLIPFRFFQAAALHIIWSILGSLSLYSSMNEAFAYGAVV